MGIWVLPTAPDDFSWTEAAVTKLQQDYCTGKLDVGEFEEQIERALSDHGYAVSLVAPTGLPPAIGKRENR